VVCEAGSFSDKTGQAACQDCPGNLYSVKGAPSCLLCLKGFFYSLAGACVECSAGLICDADGGSTQQELTIDKGYWRLTSTTDIIHACPIPGSCIGGGTFVAIGGQQRRLAQDSDVYCEKGYVGPICASCDPDGYFFDPDLQQCLLCEKQGGIGKRLISSTSLIVPLSVVVAVLLIVALAFAMSRKRSSDKKTPLLILIASSLNLNKDTMRVNRDGSLSFLKKEQTEPPKSWKLKTRVTWTSLAKIIETTTTMTVASETSKVKTTIIAPNSLDIFATSVRETKNKFKALTAFR